jgi:hypothetical protein
MATTAVLAPYTEQQFFATNGTPLAGGLLTTYAAGTTTPIATYTDSTGGTPNANPIVLNAFGRASIWLSPNVLYKFALTDSAGNVIPGWPVDNISVSQLLTLFGGVDTGIANAYVLNFTASFAAYANGIVLYWVPANTNTGASTLTVNSLATIPIINQNGNTLVAGQIVAGQIAEVIYYNGKFQLFSNSVYLPGVSKVYVKNANTTIASSTVLTIDPDLQITLAAGTYIYEFVLDFYSQSGSNGGISLQPSVAASATNLNYFSSNVNGTGAVGAVATHLPPVTFATLSHFVTPTFPIDSCIIKGSFTITTSSVFALYWAQNSSSAGNAVMFASSWMQITGGSAV